MTINSQGKLVLNSTSGSSDYEITPNDGLLGIDGYLGVGDFHSSAGIKRSR